jgi:V8-like Glu-specific endopeptidase
MSWLARRARSVRPWVRVLIVLAVAACGIALLIPTNVGAVVFARHPASPTPSAAPTSSPSPTTPPTTSGTSRAFAGVAAVGALFTMSDGQLGTHFCTASVVHSTDGDLAVTAAHCLAENTGQIAFVPGYANGKEPYGSWPVTAVYTDQAWQSDQDPDDDFAFLRLSDSSGGVPIEDVTGAERLGTASRTPTLVQVIGYPNDANLPVSCPNWAKSFSPTQLEFDCDGYTDGTSGGPFLASVSRTSGQGTIIGVIGGYEQGGDTPDVSYAAAFGPAVTALYHTAEADG